MHIRTDDGQLIFNRIRIRGSFICTRLIFTDMKVNIQRVLISVPGAANRHALVKLGQYD